MSTHPSHQPTVPALLQAVIDTLSTLRMQMSTLQTAILQPPAPAVPPSPDNTILIPGPRPGDPTLITDTSQNTWTLAPHGPQSTPTLFINGYPDPIASPVTQAIWLSRQLFFQKVTGQWFFWTTSHWTPVIDPRPDAARDWGLPALRAIDWNPSQLPERLRPQLNHDLLADIFTDNSHRADTFETGPIPITTRPWGPRPALYQRSDNTFILPIWGPTSPVTYQFPGLRPTFIRLWDGLRPLTASPSPSTSQPLRVATGTDTIAVPFTRQSFFIIELSLG